MLKKKRILSLVLVLILLLSACTPATDNNTNDNKTPNGNETTNENTDNKGTQTNNNNNANSNNTTTTAVRYEDIKTTPIEAFDSFMEKHPNSKVESLKLDLENGSYLYKVEGYDDTNEYELYIDTKDGKVVKEDQSVKKDVEGEIIKDDVNKVKELVDKTLSQAGNNSKLDEWTLESRNGKPILEVKTMEDNKEIEYKYDVKTGDLIDKD